MSAYNKTFINLDKINAGKQCSQHNNNALLSLSSMYSITRCRLNGT